MSNIEEFTLYGEYNWDDPIYKVLRRETASPRFKLFLMKQASLTKVFYQYTDQLALRARGNINLDDLMRKQRRLLVDEGIVTDANETLKENCIENHHPHKDLEEDEYEYAAVWCG